MKTTAKILFAVLLTGLVNFTFSQPSDDPDLPFISEVLTDIKNTSPGVIPWAIKFSLNHHLRRTPAEFKDLCINYSNMYKSKNIEWPALNALRKSVSYVFDYFTNNCAEDEKSILRQIEKVDPLGLITYLAANLCENLFPSPPTFSTKVSSKSYGKKLPPNFKEFVLKFEPTMKHRLHLHNMRTNDSYITVFDENHDRTLHHVPLHIRNQICNENGDFHYQTLDLFTEIITENSGYKMYKMNYKNAVKYEELTLEEPDVQISYGEPNGKDEPGHAVCTYYHPDDKRVYVYDSAMFLFLDDSQLENIRRRYGHNTGIEYARPMDLQNEEITCALFAIAYAILILDGKNPCNTRIPLNEVYGDRTLYIRIHLLNILVNRKYASFKELYKLFPL